METDYKCIRITIIISIPLTIRTEVWAKVSRNQNVRICVTGADEIWLCNSADNEIVLDAGELCGFNVGSYKEKSVGPMLGCSGTLDLVVSVRSVAS